MLVEGEAKLVARCSQRLNPTTHNIHLIGDNNKQIVKLSITSTWLVANTKHYEIAYQTVQRFCPYQAVNVYGQMRATIRV